jgi:DNA-binding transcriptional regulator PaaX
MIVHLIEAIMEGFTGEKYLYPRPYESMYHFAQRLREVKRQQFTNSIWQMQRQGLIKIITKNNQKFIQCTKKGQLEILLRKAIMQKPHVWDGKWRVVIFDIPEDSRDKRNQLRSLLKKNDFIKLQASVFVSPYPLNREAVKYLQETGLIDYIMFLKVEEMDNDKDLRKQFGLK